MPKPRKVKETQVERRLKCGALIMATNTGDPKQPVAWTYTDTGHSARADVCVRLLSAGVLHPRGDGLFAELSQTYGLSQ